MFLNLSDHISTISLSTTPGAAAAAAQLSADHDMPAEWFGVITCYKAYLALYGSLSTLLMTNRHLLNDVAVALCAGCSLAYLLQEHIQWVLKHYGFITCFYKLLLPAFKAFEEPVATIQRVLRPLDNRIVRLYTTATACAVDCTSYVLHLLLQT